jgi:succinylglutamate desuccinylase
MRAGGLVFGLIVAAQCVGCAQRVAGPPRSALPVSPELPAEARPLPFPAEPGMERQVWLGSSVEGRPLTLTIFGAGSPCFLIMGGTHGDEPSSACLAEQLIEHLRDEPDAYAGRTVAILPAVNPDGLAAGTRTNANGVDLNRNFPARNWRAATGRTSHGTHPASEPETRAVVKALEYVRPTCIVSLHAITGGRQCNNYDGPARELAHLLAGFNGYPVQEYIGYPTPGSLGTWTGADLAVPTVTLELPNMLSCHEAWQDNSAALLALIRSDAAAVMPTAR